MWTFRTPLAWLQLTHNVPRLLGNLAGVAFAAVLMFLELGFLNGLYDSHTNVVKHMNADLIIMNRYKEAVTPKLPFPRRRLTQALGHPAILAAYPVYVEDFGSVWKNKTNRNEHLIMVYGIRPEDPVFLFPEVLEQASKLKVLDTALIDTRGKELYGARTAGVEGELTLRAVRLVGTFRLGPDFRADGNMIVSDQTFFKCFANPRVGADPSKVEFGLLRVSPGADVRAVRAALLKSLPDDIQIMTRQEFVNQIVYYWTTFQPIGYVFGMGTLVGFLIGVTICYQILYTDIMDHSPQYATLKAMGYSNRFLVLVVLQEAVILGVLGYFPGLLVSLGGYAALQAVSGILMQMSLGSAILVFVLTVAMCIASGVLALRRVILSDPTEVF